MDIFYFPNFGGGGLHPDFPHSNANSVSGEPRPIIKLQGCVGGGRVG